MQVLDYSAGFPGAANIKAAGYGGAVRYVGFSGRRKCANAAEVRDFTDHGLGMAAVFEDNTSRWRTGFNGGHDDGTAARQHATAIGLPTSLPIYMAIDQDVVATGEFSVMIDYLRGAAGPLGGANRVGVYGEADVLDAARVAKVAGYYWQTVAWSRGRRTEANLFQRLSGVTVGGIACDVNDVLQPDWGQHLITVEGADMTPEQADQLKQIKDVLGVAYDKATGQNAGTRIMATETKVNELASDVAEIKALLTNLVGPGVTIGATGSITLGPVGK